MRSRHFTATYLIAFLAATIVFFLILFPHEGFAAAIRGVSIWWDVLFPALFPFFVISEILLGFGIVHWVGTMLDPMMRPVFRVPGIGGFVMAMGFASGYPVGARLTSQIWDQRLVNRDEAERLIAFTTTSDPIFLIGAVAIGFFHDVSLSLLLAIAHYGGAVAIGLLMRFHGSSPPTTSSASTVQGGIWKRAFHAMHNARIQDGRSVGVLLGQAIQHSLALIFVVGGLVVFFSVVLEVLTAGGVMGILYTLINSVLQFAGLPSQLSEAVMKGLFEVTLGAKAAGAAVSSIPLVSKTAIAAFVLSWAGLSVHAQIVSLLSHTNLRYSPFLIARLLHGLISAAIVLMLWTPLEAIRGKMTSVIPVFQSSPTSEGFLKLIIPLSGLLFVITFAVIAVLFLAYSLFKTMYEKVGGFR